MELGKPGQELPHPGGIHWVGQLIDLMGDFGCMHDRAHAQQVLDRGQRRGGGAPPPPRAPPGAPAGAAPSALVAAGVPPPAAPVPPPSSPTLSRAVTSTPP